MKNNELITQLKSIEYSKGIEEGVLNSIIEEAFALLYDMFYNQEIADSKGYYNPKTGTIHVTCCKEVIPDNDPIQHENNEIHYSDAKKIDESIELPTGKNLVEIEIILDEIPSNLILRSHIQRLSQFVKDRLNRAREDAVYESLKKRIGELVSGTAIPLHRGNYSVHIGSMEVSMPKEQVIPGEKFKQGDVVCGVLVEQTLPDERNEVVISRISPELPVQLVAQEVTEVSDDFGIIKVEKVAREPGRRTKLAVSSSDPKIDPVGTIIGQAGRRIKNVLESLGHERVDVFTHSHDQMTLLENMIKGYSVEKIKVSEDQNKITIIVPDDTEESNPYSAILGKMGSNVRLMAKMLGDDIDLSIQRLATYKDQLETQRNLLLHSQIPELDLPLQLPDAMQLVNKTLEDAGINTLRGFLEKTRGENEEIGLSSDLTEEILDRMIEEYLPEMGE